MPMKTTTTTTIIMTTENNSLLTMALDELSTEIPYSTSTDIDELFGNDLNLTPTEEENEYK